MNQFAGNVNNQKTTTENGMKARVSAGLKTVDLFYKIGASRGKDIVPEFQAALVEDQDKAVRILLNARDVREGKGERQIFRDVLKFIDINYPELVERIVAKIPEIGRWDDGFSIPSLKGRKVFYALIAKKLESNDNIGLLTKWLPREKSAKKQFANELMHFLGMKPKQYRKMLVKNTNVVEQKMCANQWNEINFSHVPSCAMSLYKRAFPRHTERFAQYLEDLKNNVSGVKINATAIFPHVVIKEAVQGWNIDSITRDTIIQQWQSLPDYMNDKRVLPMVDVSGSMDSLVPGSNYSCMTVAISLGLYCAERNKGDYKDLFLTFSGNPALLSLKGNIIEKVKQMQRSDWEMNTDLAKAFDLILKHGIQFKVPDNEMPEMVLILSDMQFDADWYESKNRTAFKMIKQKYKDAGYTMPKIVFWNLNSKNNVPVKFDKSGAALVSGFSPSILTSVLSDNVEHFTPEGVMLEAIMKERYNW